MRPTVLVFSATFVPSKHPRDGEAYAFRLSTADGRKLVDVREPATFEHGGDLECGVVCDTAQIKIR